MGEYIVGNDKNFDELIKEGVTVVDFFATWCMPCKMLSPIIEELAADYDGKAKIVKLDIDAAGKTAEEYKVYSVPTVIVFKNGKEIERSSGYNQKAAFAQMIDRNL